jgi:hypothetical protein
MAVKIEFPEMPRVPETVGLFMTPPPRWDEDRISRLASNLGVRGDRAIAGNFRVVRDRESVLEIYEASDSLRWGHLATDPEGRQADGSLPDEAESIRIADEFLRRAGLGDERTTRYSVTYTEVARSERDQIDPPSQRTAVHVNYRYSLDQLPIFGPGAKMQVTIGSQGRVVEMYRFWREPKKSEQTAVLPAGQAAAALQNHELFADLDEGSARVAIERVSFGYYAFPPMEPQGALLPVYVFAGVISTPLLERYEFAKRVFAATLTAPQTKRLGAVSHALESVF